jgi:hypothetical protein
MMRIEYVVKHMRPTYCTKYAIAYYDDQLRCRVKLKEVQYNCWATCVFNHLHKNTT